MRFRFVVALLPFLIGLSPLCGAQTILKAGEDVFVTVNFDEPVVVNGEPTVNLMVGTQIVEAIYTQKGSTGKALRFKYVIQQGDMDVNGIAIIENSLKNTVDRAGIPTSTIQSEAGNDASLLHAGLLDSVAMRVDTKAPSISTISISTKLDTTNDLNKGHTVIANVEFDELVIVTGEPTLNLRVNGRTVEAVFTGVGDLVNSQQFTYTSFVNEQRVCGWQH